MFNYFYEWLRNLAFYMVLVTAVLQLIPNRSYKIYSFLLWADFGHPSFDTGHESHRCRI